MLRRILLASLFAVLALGAVVSAETVTFTGSTTVLPIAQATQEALAGQYDIEVFGGGSSRGIAALIDGTTDIGDHSRGIKGSEYEVAVANGTYPFTWHVAQDALAPVVHPSNPITELSMQQLRDIYNGTIVNWSEVGGEDKPILAVSRDDSSGTFETWEKRVMGGEELRMDLVIQTSNASVASEVAGNPYAIGYVGLGYVNSSLKALDVEGVSPTLATAISGEFSISRPLFMSTNGFPTGDTLGVIQFILSDAGQQVVMDVGFAPIRPLPGM